ncbi:uncharacterized protein BO80DRAFT_46085 [Aspergillus ibericus CBS 121593]|uniref:Arrestin-like N-terminal domain-containing protein n=1 Tax=Aspergillus ibericus CBS 121593 TaxID=1448316 RepID=A0A395H1Y8_9EURO|nr:hypothetical protein BO80DRAFT_46085 [Aspergillus ibericus CBS 121593]RAL01887.1 hypothetical protein BO80DRAFT_46085 [Aspergillus ibericus CBS 121593]
MARPKISIHIHNRPDDAICVFSTLDTISGEVAITFEHNISYLDVKISFEGASSQLTGSSIRMLIGDIAGRTTVTIRNDFGGQSKAAETFLHLEGHVDDKPLLENGTSQTFPFAFVVPKALSSFSCQHSSRDTLVPYAHTELPPSLGSRSSSLYSSSRNEPAIDSQCPQAVRIEYHIVASFLLQNTQSRYPVSARREICILPTAKSERPPRPFAPPLIDLCAPKPGVQPFTVHKDLKHGVFQTRLGRLSIRAVQPDPISMGLHSGRPAHTLLTLHMRFETCHNIAIPPPALSRITTSLRAITFFSTSPWTEIPTDPVAVRKQMRSGVYVKTVQLGMRELASVIWEECPGDQGEQSGKIVYEAVVQTPVLLPNDRVFVPTFHSCLVARCYELLVKVSYRGRNGSLPGRVAVDVPVTVGVG